MFYTAHVLSALVCQILYFLGVCKNHYSAPTHLLAVLFGMISEKHKYYTANQHMTSRPRAFSYRAMQNASPALLLTVFRELRGLIPDYRNTHSPNTGGCYHSCARNIKLEATAVRPALYPKTFKKREDATQRSSSVLDIW